MDKMRQFGGRKLVVQTDGRADYEPTRRFYKSCGFQIEGQLKDYYAPGDDCVIFATFVE